jgi:hypothetical protein
MNILSRLARWLGRSPRVEEPSGSLAPVIDLFERRVRRLPYWEVVELYRLNCQEHHAAVDILIKSRLPKTLRQCNDRLDQLTQELKVLLRYM